MVNSFRQKIMMGWRRLLVAGLVVYVGVCLGVGLCQRTLLYHPRVYSAQQVDDRARSYGLERWRNAAGEPVGMKRMSARQPSDGRVLIVYGNGGSAVSDGHYVPDIQKFSAFDVYILEYPGYEDRPGKPTEQSLFRAADEALRLLGTNKPVFVLGESLGTGVASYLAGTYPDRVAGVVLIAPYNRLAAAAQFHYPLLPVGLLLLDRFPSEDYLQRYHGPVGILVGGRDQVVPERLGRRLYDGYLGPKRLWEFPEDGHGDLFHRVPEIWSQFIELWQAEKTDPKESSLAGVRL
jgi:pimeloyl-ACP methyl ester carboxylesterase